MAENLAEYYESKLKELWEKNVNSMAEDEQLKHVEQLSLMESEYQKEVIKLLKNSSIEEQNEELNIKAEKLQKMSFQQFSEEFKPIMKALISSQIIVEEEIKVNPSYKCPICQKNYKDYSNFLNWDDCKSVANFICDLCGRTFEFKQSYEKHYEQCKKDIQNEVFKDKTITCKHCYQTFIEKDFNQHLDYCQGLIEVQCNYCEWVGKETELEEHLRTCVKKAQVEEEKQCQYCHNKFPQYLIEDHLKVCEIKKNYDRQQLIQQQQHIQQQQQQQLQQQNSDLDEYERLLRLDDKIEKIGLKNEQLEQLPQFCFHQDNPKLAMSKSQVFQSELATCSICYDEFQNGDQCTTLPCFHIYHSKCIKQWLNESKICPICRNEIQQ